MRVLIMHPKVPIYGGAERVVVKLCEYLSNHAIPHALAMPGLPSGMREDLTGTPIISNLASLIANLNNFDVINFHNFPTTLFSMITNKPMVWYCNEPPEMFTSRSRKFIEWGNRNLIKNRILNIAVADKFNARRCSDLYDVSPLVIPYGIDYDFFSQNEHNPDPNYFTVIQVGTISRYKNQMATVKAVFEARNRIPNIRLWLVGNVSEPTYKKEIENYILCQLAPKIVTWIPHIGRSQLRYYYSQSDVLLHPVKAQGGWLTPFESISAGCPVIVSNELTCSDLIENNQLGLVARDYVKALINIKTCPNILGMTQIAREWVRVNLTWDKFGENMVKYFEEVLCRKS